MFTVGLRRSAWREARVLAGGRRSQGWVVSLLGAAAPRTPALKAEHAYVVRVTCAPVGRTRWAWVDRPGDGGACGDRSGARADARGLDRSHVNLRLLIRRRRITTRERQRARWDGCPCQTPWAFTPDTTPKRAVPVRPVRVAVARVSGLGRMSTPASRRSAWRGARSAWRGARVLAGGCRPQGWVVSLLGAAAPRGGSCLCWGLPPPGPPL